MKRAGNVATCTTLEHTCQHGTYPHPHPSPTHPPPIPHSNHSRCPSQNPFPWLVQAAFTPLQWTPWDSCGRGGATARDSWGVRMGVGMGHNAYNDSRVCWWWCFGGGDGSQCVQRLKGVLVVLMLLVVVLMGLGVVVVEEVARGIVNC